jgi:hypothetical protein
VTNLADYLAGISYSRSDLSTGEKLLMPRLLWDNIELLGCVRENIPILPQLEFWRSGRGIVIPALMNSGVVFYSCNTPIPLTVFVAAIGDKIAIRDLP